MTARPIRVILDASAIVRYVHSGTRAIDIGEVIAEVSDDGVAGLPVLCMAQALRTVGEGFGDRFQLLVEHLAAELVAEPEDWRGVAYAVDLTGRWDAAVAALLAIDLGVAVLTAESRLYHGFQDPYLVIEV